MKEVFPFEIATLSPRYCEIFNQALAAESYDLNEIAGPGYGKALEILVKDFAKRQKPSDIARIEQAKLGQVINNSIDDENIKTVTKRATWLRNDEIHYVRIWKDKDIGHLKGLIQLTVNWIDNVLRTEKLKEEMPDRS